MNQEVVKFNNEAGAVEAAEVIVVVTTRTSKSQTIHHTIAEEDLAEV
jgi:hypothetical protein